MATNDVLRVQGNYTIKTSTGGLIRLDTGATTGTVVVTGNLDVQGTTTTIESQNSTIKDNSITLNFGQQTSVGGLGQVSLGTSGLIIDRGSAGDPTLSATFLYNDTKTWRAGSSVYTGVFEFSVGNNASAIRTGGILVDPRTPTTSGRQAIYFIGNQAGITNAVLTLVTTMPNTQHNQTTFQITNVSRI
jgi:hypothetical protein